MRTCRRCALGIGLTVRAIVILRKVKLTQQEVGVERIDTHWDRPDQIGITNIEFQCTHETEALTIECNPTYWTSHSPQSASANSPHTPSKNARRRESCSILVRYPMCGEVRELLTIWPEPLSTKWLKTTISSESSLSPCKSWAPSTSLLAKMVRLELSVPVLILNHTHTHLHIHRS